MPKNMQFIQEDHLHIFTSFHFYLYLKMTKQNHEFYSMKMQQKVKKKVIVSVKKCSKIHGIIQYQSI